MARHLLRYILLLAIVTPAFGQSGRSWWYPLGTPEGTHRILGATAPQSADSLIIKWRTKKLKNSPVLLVGSIRSGIVGGKVQQVIGMENNLLTILSERGVVQEAVDYTPYLPTNSDNRAVLTGLFDTTAPSTAITSAPNVIGIGVEGTQPSGDSFHAYLASGTGSPLLRMSVLFPDEGSGNRWAKFSPIASFSPSGYTMILTLLSQDRFVSQGSAPANGIRRFRTTGVIDAALQWSYDIAPMTLPQQPAMSYNPINGNIGPSYLAVSTSTYTASPQFTATPAIAPVKGITRSDTMYSIDVRVSDPNPSHIDTRRIPQTPLSSSGTFRGEADNYIATLYSRSGQADYYRVITENHDPARPGSGSISLARLFDSTDASGHGYFSDPAIPAVNVGWTVATADVDGNAPGSQFQYNNQNDEVVAAWRALDGSELETNWLYVLHSPEGPQSNDPLAIAARQRFSGRLMAAGDIVSDSNGRAELVVAHKDTLFILQLKSYSDVGFDPLVPPEQRKPFQVMKSFVLDADIVSVALADLEGDNQNDIVVCTKSSTYAIGLPQPYPFDQIYTTLSEYCQGDSATVKWGHLVGGGDAGLNVSIRGASGTVPLLSHRKAAASDSLRFPTANLADRFYRLYVYDEDAPSVIDSSMTIIVDPRAINPITVESASNIFHFGDTLKINGTPKCFAGDVKVVQATGSVSGWDTIPATITRDGSGSYHATFQLQCPAVASCTPGGEDSLRFRFAGVNGSIQSATIAVAIDNSARVLGISPGDDTSRARRRLVTWDPSTFGCDSVDVAYSFDGVTWNDLGITANSMGAFPVETPADKSGKVQICVHCEDHAGLVCAIGRGDFMTVPLGENFVAPNPFNPLKPRNDVSGQGAAISYNLTQPTAVTITIYDAARAVVRRLADHESQESGRRLTNWDGTNSRGEIVANGTYICVIETSSQEPIILPIVVLKR